MWSLKKKKIKAYMGPRGEVKVENDGRWELSGWGL